MKCVNARPDPIFAQALWNSLTGNADRIAFVHVNYLGAPIAVTEVAGQILWQADYAPYGKLIKPKNLSWYRANCR